MYHGFTRFFCGFACWLVCGSWFGSALAWTLENASPATIEAQICFDEPETEWRFWYLSHKEYIPSGATYQCEPGDPVPGKPYSYWWGNTDGWVRLFINGAGPYGVGQYYFHQDADLKYYVDTETMLGTLGAYTNFGGAFMSRKLTNWVQFTNVSSVLPGAEDLRDAAHDFATQHDGYWTNGGTFHAARGHWQSKFGFLDDYSAATWSTNDFDFSNFAPDPSGIILEGHLEGISFLGRVLPAWSWYVLPEVPEALLPDFEFFVRLCNLVIRLVVSALLWWYVKNDIEERLRDIALVPQAQGAGTEVAGFKAGFAGALLAATACVAVMLVFATAMEHLLGWAGFAANPSSLVSSLRNALETGVIGTSFSGWMVVAMYYVSQVVPLDFLGSSAAFFITYHFVRWPAFRLGVIGMKFAQGIL